ncbi:hypothetical protein Ciccas_012724, partial [Cichlidogyrus casuarinus]
NPDLRKTLIRKVGADSHSLDRMKKHKSHQPHTTPKKSFPGKPGKDSSLGDGKDDASEYQEGSSSYDEEVVHPIIYAADNPNLRKTLIEKEGARFPSPDEMKNLESHQSHTILNESLLKQPSKYNRDNIYKPRDTSQSKGNDDAIEEREKLSSADGETVHPIIYAADNHDLRRMKKEKHKPHELHTNPNKS